MPRGTIAGLAALILWWLSGGTAAGDTLRLKNGNVLEGTITKQDERQVTIELPDVGAMVVERADIAALEDADNGAPAGSALQPAAPVNPDDLALFERPERDVRLSYPKVWHLKDRLDRHPYTVTITPKPFDPSARDFTVLELRKFYHASRTLGLKADSEAELLELFLRKFREKGAQLLDQHPVQVQGVTGQRMEARVAGPKSVIRMLVLVAVKDDALASLYCHAPAADFERFRGFFEAAAERWAPFAAAQGQSDNARLDAESARLTQGAVEAVQRRDETSAVSRLQEALRANPGDIATRAAYGSLLFDLALAKQDPQRGAALARAEAELQSVVEWLEALGDPQQAPALAQAYFLLGEIQSRGRNRPEQAKPLYKKALAAHPAHEGAKRALSR
jgi:hypothetical protein